MDHNGGCSSEPGDLGHCGANLNGVVATNRECSNYRGHFLRHKSTQPWPLSFSFPDIVKAMSDEGSNTVVLIGDSVTSQMLSDMFCRYIIFTVLMLMICDSSFVECIQC